MKAVILTLGKFHSFDLARQLHKHDALAAIYTAYPRFKLRGERLPPSVVRTFPFVHTPYMATPVKSRLSTSMVRAWELLDRISLDRYAAARLPSADLLIALSGCGLHAGLAARARGMRYVCDRGSTHIRHQDEILAEEHARWGVPYVATDPRIVEREEREYAAADLITVPSSFVRDTFLKRGFDARKLRVLPYGVDLSTFQPRHEPVAGQLDLLFVGTLSYRKGVPDLLAAYRDIEHPRKSLKLAGTFDPRFVEQLRLKGLLDESIELLGHVPQGRLKDLMSASHALVLPSIEEGLALVMGQALASGCPVVATPNTGAQDLFENDREGFIVPARAPRALTQALQKLADSPETQSRLRHAALERVDRIGGWDLYGERAIRIFEDLVSSHSPVRSAA